MKPLCRSALSLKKKNDELKKSNEDQALHIEHLEEQILKRNKMLFGQKSEKSKFICNGQIDLDGNVFNEAEELSNLSATEPTEDSITKNRRKPESIGEEMNCVVILKRKRSCIHFPKISGNVRSAAVSSCRFQKNTSPHGSALSLRRSLRSHTFVRSTNVNTAISTEIRRIL